MSSTRVTKPFENGQASALVATVVFAAISLVVIIIAGIHIGWSILSSICKGMRCPRLIYFQSQLGYYSASLVMSSFLSSIGYTINLRWIILGKVLQDSECTAQGVLAQIGNSATAYFVGAIAIHTFNSLVLRRRLPFWLSIATIVFGWISSIVIGIVPVYLTTDPPAYGFNSFTCGISIRYPLLQTVLLILPFFLSALISSVFYPLIFLILRGTIAIDGGLRLNFNPEIRWQEINIITGYKQFIVTIARSLLWYPTAYIVLSLPLVMVYVAEVSGSRVSFGSNVFVNTCASMQGLAFVVMMYNTLRVLTPIVAPPSTATRNNADRESFVSRAQSPVDTVPVNAARAFPPPRSVYGENVDRSFSPIPVTHPKFSKVSFSDESTRRLIPGRTPYSHQYSSSMASDLQTMSTCSQQHSIASMTEFNHMISVPPPVQEKDTMSIVNIRPMRRTAGVIDSMHSVDYASSQRSLSVLRPRRMPSTQLNLSASVVDTPQPSAAFAAVSLQSADGQTPLNHDRNSFINMYASQSPATSNIGVKAFTSGESQRMTFGSVASSSASVTEISSHSTVERQSSMTAELQPRWPALSAIKVPRDNSWAIDSAVGVAIGSPFSAVPARAETNASPQSELSRVPTSGSLQEELQNRTDSADPEEQGISSLAWASVVHAAMPDGPSPVTSNLKTTRRRSKSVDSTPIPLTLRPGTTSPAALPSSRRFAVDAVPGWTTPARESNLVERSDSARSVRRFAMNTPPVRHTVPPVLTSVFPSPPLVRARTVGLPRNPRQPGFF